ncbi:efflux transporter%2C RND family%2C MFP subunit [Mycobacteroides abscessus]|nr:efflux transporter%2C RND family%2C MFP subunit [Mycobacteroides abscessus]
MVPVTAVLGRVEQGKVWVVGAEGEPEERTVTLGLTDGAVVQVTEGLAEGDEVLEFVPGQDVMPVMDDMMMTDDSEASY